MRADSEAKSGLYRIQMPGLKPTVVECVMEHGTGYTVVQKRTTGHLSFNQNWEAYKARVGNADFIYQIACLNFM